jgi:hypothetical protein
MFQSNFFFSFFFLHCKNSIEFFRHSCYIGEMKKKQESFGKFVLRKNRYAFLRKKCTNCTKHCDVTICCLLFTCHALMTILITTTLDVKVKWI